MTRADGAPPPHSGGGAPAPRWKGLNRRHPAAVTATRIREHIAHYQVTGEPADQLAGAATALDNLARQEPNK